MKCLELALASILFVSAGYVGRSIVEAPSPYVPNYVEVEIEAINPTADWAPPVKIEKADLVPGHINIANITDISHYRGYTRKTPRVLVTLANSKELVVVSDYDDFLKEVKKATTGNVVGN